VGRVADGVEHSVETMGEHGLLEEWDRRSRAAATEDAATVPPLRAGERAATGDTDGNGDGDGGDTGADGDG
jgi:hypothetical protein